MNTRPVYEQQADRDNELIIKDVLERAWKCKIELTPKFYPCDFIAYRDGTAEALIEVKRRKIKRGTYSTLHISFAKMVHLKSLAEFADLKPILIAALDDCILHHTVTGHYPVVYGGRKDRNDPDDMEPLCNIPFDYFKEVKEINECHP